MKHSTGISPGRRNPLAVSIACLLLVACGSPNTDTEPQTSRAEVTSISRPIIGGTVDTRNPTGEIYIPNRPYKPGASYCGGVAITRLWFLTAAHCKVDSADTVYLRAAGNQLRSVVRTIPHPTLDLALVQVNAPFVGIDGSTDDTTTVTVTPVNGGTWPSQTPLVCFGNGPMTLSDVGGTMNKAVLNVSFSGTEFVSLTNSNPATSVSPYHTHLAPGDSGGACYLPDGSLVSINRAVSSNTQTGAVIASHMIPMTQPVIDWIANTIDPLPSLAATKLTSDGRLMGWAQEYLHYENSAVTVRSECMCGTSVCGVAADMANDPFPEHGNHGFDIKVSCPYDGAWHSLNAVAENLGPIPGERSIGVQPPFCRTSSGSHCDGQLLRNPNTQGVYLVVGGAGYLLPGGLEEAHNLGYSINNLATDDLGVIGQLRSAPSDGTLLLAPDGVVYVVYGGAKFPLPDSVDIYDRMGLNPANIRRVPGYVLALLADQPQPDPASPAIQDGKTLKEWSCGRVFVLAGGAKFLAPSSPTTCGGMSPLRFDEAGMAMLSTGPTEVPDEYIAALPTVPRDGTYLRESSSGTIYRIEGGRTLPIPSQQAWGHLGLPETDSAKAIVIADGETASLSPVAGFGRLENLSSDELTGWFLVPGGSNSGVQIHFFVDGPDGIGRPVDFYSANQFRPDIDSAFGVSGSRGFKIPVPAWLRDGSAHTYFAYIEVPGILPRTLLRMSNQSATYPPVIGWLDGVDEFGVLRGWMINWEQPSSIQHLRVEFQCRNGTITGGLTPVTLFSDTTEFRADVNEKYRVNGTHGLAIPVPEECRTGRKGFVRVSEVWQSSINTQDYWLSFTGPTEYSGHMQFRAFNMDPFGYLNMVLHGHITEASRVVYRGTDGHIHELWLSQYGWNYNNLTALTGGALAAGAPMAYTNGNSQHSEHYGITPRVVYRGTDDHIHELSLLPLGWRAQNLSASAREVSGTYDGGYADSDPIGYEGPNPGGLLSTFTPRVHYRSRSGNQRELYLTSDGWLNWDIYSATTCARISTRPAPYRGNVWGSIGIRNGTVLHLYKIASEYECENLSGKTGAPAAKGKPSIYGDNEAFRVVFRGTDNHIHEIRLEDGAWGYFNLTQATGAASYSRAAGSPYGYASEGGIANVVYRGEDGNVYRLWLSSTGWVRESLTSLTGAPKAAGEPMGYNADGLPGYIGNGHRVVYRGIDGHIYELRQSGTNWYHWNMTWGTPAPR